MCCQLRPAGAGYGRGESKHNNEVKTSRKEPEMAYKKPQIVAKSAAKQTMVAGCPALKVYGTGCCPSVNRCFCGPQK